MTIELTTEERQALHDALLQGTTGYDDLGVIVSKAGFRIGDVAVPAPMPAVVDRVIEHFRSRDSVADLVLAARMANPRNGRLLKVAVALGVEPGDPGAAARDAAPADSFGRVESHLERMVDRERGISDLGTFAARVQEWLAQVCRIELAGQSGTGFLIGRSTVLTNHHVVAKLLDGTVRPGDVEVRFDHYRLRDGVGLNSGVVHGLAPDWLVAARPHSQVDLRPYDPSVLPDGTQLDYAILRLDAPVGDETATWTGRPRRWLLPRGPAWDFADGSFLLVVQHPCREPISYDGGTDAVVRVNGNGTRVHYRINTLPGSSGSPVFNRALELVALHHGGQPGSPDLFLPCEMQVSLADYNEGIPIANIVADVEAQGAGWAFGGDVEEQAEAHVLVDSSPRDTNLQMPNELDLASRHLHRASNVESAPPPVAAATSVSSSQSDARSRPRVRPPSNTATVAGSERARFEARVDLDAAQESRPPIDAARRAAQLDVQRSAVQVLRELRELMDRALDDFAILDAGDTSVDRTLPPNAYVNAVNSLAQAIDDEQWGEVDQARLLHLLHGLVGHVLVGIEVSQRHSDFGVVADLSKKAADAYSTVGGQLDGEPGAMLVRVAPYWQMKSAYALYQRNEQKQKLLARGNTDPSRRTG